MKQKILYLFLFLSNTICFSQDLFSGGSNSWIFHTPDDGRTTLHIAPLIDNVYNFGYQTVFDNTGNVVFSGSIGIGSTQLTSQLSIGINHGIKLSVGNAEWANPNIIVTGYNYEVGDFTDIKFAGHAANPANIRMTQYGNVGIGTSNPQAKLDVNGSIQMGGGADNFYGFGQSSSSKPIDVRTGSHYPYVFNWHEGLTFSTHSGYGGIRFYNQGYPDMFGAGVMVMSITNNNVGIGTTNPTSKLTVAGNIESREVKVTVDAGADFVFENNYDLPSLESVDKFIKENRHLPEIASAEEMKKDGINLSEMNIKLLKKIEELTLYMIEMKNCNDAMKTEIEKQNKEIELLKLKNKN